VVNFFIASSLGKKPSPQSGAAINLSLSIYLKTAFIFCSIYCSVSSLLEAIFIKPRINFLFLKSSNISSSLYR